MEKQLEVGTCNLIYKIKDVKAFKNFRLCRLYIFEYVKVYNK